MMDRRNWPWRKKISHNSTLISDVRNPNSTLIGDVRNPNSASSFRFADAWPPLKAGAYTEASPAAIARQALTVSSAPNPSLLEKRRHTSLLENAEAFEALELKEDTELQAHILTQRLGDAEKSLLDKEAMVKQHAKVAEEAVSGWEKAEAEALSLKQELALSAQQNAVLDRRVAELKETVKSSNRCAEELEEALKASLKQLRQTQEDHQQKTHEAIDRKAQEWAAIKEEMDEIEQHLRQCMLAAEARSCAMAKSLEERARAVTESQEAKERAEMEAGLLQVKLESQATEMAAIRYEVQVLTKELDIRKHENEHGRKAADAAHKQHLEDVKKITKLDAECKRLRTLLKKRLPGPAAVAQMRIEADKGQQIGRRSLGSSNLSVSGRNTKSFSELTDKLHAVEEEANILRETLAKRSAELDSARVMYALTANKLSAAEEQVDSLQGTPKSARSARSTQKGALESFLLRSKAGSVSDAISDRPDDEVSCAESWASALISELAHLKNPNYSANVPTLGSTPEHFSEPERKPLKSISSKVQRPGGGAHDSPSSQDLSHLRTTTAGKDSQLQSANLMCKNAMEKLAAAEAKLGDTWISANPRSSVEESVNFVSEAHSMMSKLDKMLDDICIAAASVGDTTDDDHSDDGCATSRTPNKCTNAALSSELESSKEQIEKQAHIIDELRTQVSTLETAQMELQLQLNAKEDELKQVRCEHEEASHRVEELKISELSLQSQLEKITAEEKATREELQAQIEAKQNEVAELQNNVTSLGVELSDQRRKHDAAVAKCKELDLKLQSFTDAEWSTATRCKFEEDLASRANKEKEVAAAKEKLAECQRTILVLGKQLSAFTSPTSASFDSSMSLQYGIMDTGLCQDNDHTLMVHRSHQQKPLADNTGTQYADGTNFTVPRSYFNTHTSDHLPIRKPVANGMLHSRPRRIHSDLSYRTGNKTSVNGMLSVAEHLQVDDGLSSLYDSRTESAASSPSSQHTSPGESIRVHRSRYENRVGSGVRSSLAKSLECAAMPTTGDRDGESANGHLDMSSQPCNGISTKKKTASDRGKGSRSFSRFFGRSKK